MSVRKHPRNVYRREVYKPVHSFTFDVLSPALRIVPSDGQAYELLLPTRGRDFELLTGPLLLAALECQQGQVGDIAS